MSNKIPTSEEFLCSQGCQEGDSEWNLVKSSDLIEFAKLHVKAALKAAAEENYPSTKQNFEQVNKKFLNAYPEELIK